MHGFQELRTFVFRDITFDGLTESMVMAAGGRGRYLERSTVSSVRPLALGVNAGSFSLQADGGEPVTVAVVQESGSITVSGDSPGDPEAPTLAEQIVLTAILRREELRIFFDAPLRQRRLRQAAAGYGLEHEVALDRYLVPVYDEGRLSIQPRLPGLLSLGSPKLQALARQADDLQLPEAPRRPSTDRTIIVISKHKYYGYLVIDLYDAARTANGKVKPPFIRIRPLDHIASARDVGEAKFYAAVAKFQQVGGEGRSPSDAAALRVIQESAAEYACYYLDDQRGGQVSSKTLVPVRLATAPDTVRLSVSAEGALYAVTGSIAIGDRLFALHALPLKFGYFLLLEKVLYLVDSLLLLSVIELLRESGGNLYVHASKYPDFRRQLLDKLSNTIRVAYAGLVPGTEKQLAEANLSAPPERLLYLSDFGPHVMIIPVVRYGEAEVAIRTEKQVTAVDAGGNDFLVPRDDGLEAAFLGLLLKQHPHFAEQLANQLYYFYLHKSHFLDEAWFLPAFDAWRGASIEVYGFNELSGNTLSPERVRIDIKVISGVNWFNVTHAVRFGRKKASLRKIQAALRNKSRYVALDDGTQGILPQEWVDRFAAYFHAGELVDDETVRFAKANFETVATLYDASQFDAHAAREIEALRERIRHFESIEPVAEPDGLQVKLRPYQRQGLNWLGFLDTFGFGGILADDMGLGKTIQVIAFMLSQRERGRTGTDLVVVPTTLLFNWRRELATVAPSLRVLTWHGANRVESAAAFRDHDVVLTSYATLVLAIRFLKGFAFNAVYLDESQHIKNADSQRHKAVCLLQSRNRIAISGTPFENSTFDLYGQLAVACPGLLGDKRYFRDVYGRPIDQFKDRKRREALQRKIQPFMLRRTKAEVASELPAKSNMVLYSEMGDEQRNVYEAYEKEFRDFVCALSGEELDKSPMHVLRGLTRLRQICNSPALLPDGMLNAHVSGKIELLREQIKDKAPHHKVVVFSQFVAMLRLIEGMLGEIGVPYAILTGATRDRKRAVDAFQQDPAIRVFLVSLKAGGTGLNLTAADIVYVVDPWWNPAVERQAIDRVHRIGQRKDVVAYRLVTPNTVEEKILRLQATKTELASGLVSDDASFLHTLDRDRLLELL